MYRDILNSIYFNIYQSINYIKVCVLMNFNDSCNCKSHNGIGRVSERVKNNMIIEYCGISIVIQSELCTMILFNMPNK